MVENGDSANGTPELGSEITGTLIVGGRLNANGRLYPMRVLRKIAADSVIQGKIRTLTFFGNLCMPGDDSPDTWHREG